MPPANQSQESNAEFQIPGGAAEAGGAEDRGSIEEELALAPGRKRGNSGFGDTKKVIILLGLAAVGLGVVAWQFLQGRSPKPAKAVSTSPSAAVPATASTNKIESVLRRLERPDSPEGFSVARVEQLVSEFDSYVRDRQIPLARVKGRPFTVTLREDEPSVDELARAEAEAAAAAAAEAARKAEEAAEREAARLRQIRETAGRLDLGSTLLGGGRRMAVINGRVCSEGDVVSGFRIEEIGNSRVRLTYGDTTVNLDLYAGVGSP